MHPKSTSILTDATNGFRNGFRRVANGQLVDRPRAKGKENYPPITSPTMPAYTTDPQPWDPVDGMIVIKVSVPSTDDIWRFKVSQNVSLRTFRMKVELKVGFAVTFADGPTPQAKRIATEERFRRWVLSRVKNGRNNPITALKKSLLPSLAYPSTPTSPLSPNLPFTPQTPISPPPPYQTAIHQALPSF